MLVRDAGGPVALSIRWAAISAWIRLPVTAGAFAQGMIEVGQAGGAVFADTQGGLSRSLGARNSGGIDGGHGARQERRGSYEPVHHGGNILAELLAGGRVQDSSLAAGAGDITVLIRPIWGCPCWPEQ